MLDGLWEHIINIIINLNFILKIYVVQLNS